MTEKLFDCYFIATDRHNVCKVRFANDYDKRKKVLMRDNFTYNEYASDKFDRKMSKREILSLIDENELNEIEFVAYQNAVKALNRAETDEQDVLNAIDSQTVFNNILSRKQENLDLQVEA